MITGLFSWFIVGWTIVLLGLMSIGGYFMFRKFLKRLPKADGMSVLDWQEHYLKETRHMWQTEEKQLLEDLIAPVPELFRDIARDKIAGTIGKLALEANEETISQGTLIKGYIVATPKRDHKMLRKTLERKQINYDRYKQLFS